MSQQVCIENMTSGFHSDRIQWNLVQPTAISSRFHHSRSDITTW